MNVEIVLNLIFYLQIVRKFEEFMAVTYIDPRRVHDLEPTVLNNYLSNYLLVARRNDGMEFEPDTLTSIHRGLDR